MEEYRRQAQQRYHLGGGAPGQSAVPSRQHPSSRPSAPHRPEHDESRLSDEELALRLQEEEISNASRHALMRDDDDDVQFVSTSSSTRPSAEEREQRERLRREREDEELARRLQREEEMRAHQVPPQQFSYQEPDPRIPMPLPDRNGGISAFGLGMDEPLRRQMQRMLREDYSVDNFDGTDLLGGRTSMRIGRGRAQPFIPGPLPAPYLFNPFFSAQPEPEGFLPPQVYIHVPFGGGGDIDPLANMSYEDILALQERIGNVPRGVDKETIENSSVAQKIESKEQIPSDDCTICMSSFEEGEYFRRLPCLHVFHRDCIDEWLKSHDTCPICKSSIRASSESGTEQSR